MLNVVYCGLWLLLKRAFHIVESYKAYGEDSSIYRNHGYPFEKLLYAAKEEIKNNEIDDAYRHLYDMCMVQDCNTILSPDIPEYRMEYLRWLGKVGIDFDGDFEESFDKVMGYGLWAFKADVSYSYHMNLHRGIRKLRESLLSRVHDPELDWELYTETERLHIDVDKLVNL